MNQPWHDRVANARDRGAHNRIVTPVTRADLASIPAYVPGRSFPGAIKLASNETTQGPLPGVARAIADAAATANRYPDNTAAALIRALDEEVTLESWKELPADQRTAIQARVLDERAYLDIASELGTSETAVRMRVSRGLASLRGRLRNAR